MYRDKRNILLYTIVRDLNDHVEVSVRREEFPSLDDLFDLDRVSDDKFSQTLEDGRNIRTCDVRPGDDLNAIS